MAPTHDRHIRRLKRSSLVSLGFAVVGAILITIGVAVEGSSPWFLLFPAAVIVWALVDLREKRPT